MGHGRLWPNRLWPEFVFYSCGRLWPVATVANSILVCVRVCMCPDFLVFSFGFMVCVQASWCVGAVFCVRRCPGVFPSSPFLFMPGLAPRPDPLRRTSPPTDNSLRQTAQISLFFVLPPPMSFFLFSLWGSSRGLVAAATIPREDPEREKKRNWRREKGKNVNFWAPTLRGSAHLGCTLLLPPHSLLLPPPTHTLTHNNPKMQQEKKTEKTKTKKRPKNPKFCIQLKH